jgi:hypothetical protein
MSSDRRDLYSGFGDTYSRAFEMVVTPMIFGLIGWWLDSRFGTFPAIALTLGIAVFLYEIWKLVAVYSRRMDAETKKVLGGRDV